MLMQHRRLMATTLSEDKQWQLVTGVHRLRKH